MRGGAGSPSIEILTCLRLRSRVCCSVLQCVAVCCSVLQCVAVCCSAWQCAAVCCSEELVPHWVLKWVLDGVRCCSMCVLQHVCVAACVCCSMLQQLRHTALCCSLLHSVAACCNDELVLHWVVKWVLIDFEYEFVSFHKA